MDFSAGRVWEWCPPLARFLCSMEGADAQPTVGRAYRPIHVDMASYIGHTRLLWPRAPAPIVVVTALDKVISAPHSLTYWACEDDTTCEEQRICAIAANLMGRSSPSPLSEGARRTKNSDLLTHSPASMVHLFLREPLARH